MLNEYKEFESYVSNPTSKNPRIQPKLFTGLFDDECYLIGIEQIMTVIARNYIFSNKDEKTKDFVDEQTRNEAIEILHRWTGFSDIEERSRTENVILDKWMKDNSVCDGWLKDYWMFQFDEVKAKKKSRLSKEELWDILEEKWNRRLNLPLDYMTDKATYNNIIANALELGPLKNRCLIVKKDNHQVKKKKDMFKYLFDASSRQVTSDMKIIKLIAVVLVKRINCQVGQKEVQINNSELANWFAMDDSNNGHNAWYQKDAYWNNKYIYTRRKLVRNTIKVSISEEYLQEWDYRIIDIEDVAKYKETHWVLEDNGHGLKECWNII